MRPPVLNFGLGLLKNPSSGAVGAQLLDACPVTSPAAEWSDSDRERLNAAAEAAKLLLTLTVRQKLACEPEDPSTLALGAQLLELLETMQTIRSIRPD